MPAGSVCVSIVTYNSERYIRRCLESVLAQRQRPLEVVVIDNASIDMTWKILGEFKGAVKRVRSASNLGFAEAQNRTLSASRSEWVLTLNPDVLLEPDFLENLVEAAASDRQVGVVCGKLRSIGPGFAPLPEPRLDSTGMFFTPAMRHFDRGWNQPDDGRYDRREYVFGASAAAALFRRTMIADVSIGGHFFDPDFFAYREDADVAWRAQWLGWKCLYVPEAVGYHVRSVTPSNRREVPAAINMHSVKNRFLMRVKNGTSALYRRCWLPMLTRDAIVVFGTLMAEPRSLPAFWQICRCLPRALEQRREIMRRKRVSDASIAQWFSFEPASEPAPQLAAKEQAIAVGAGDLLERAM